MCSYTNRLFNESCCVRVQIESTLVEEYKWRPLLAVLGDLASPCPRMRDKGGGLRLPGEKWKPAIAIGAAFGYKARVQRAARYKWLHAPLGIQQLHSLRGKSLSRLTFLPRSSQPCRSDAAGLPGALRSFPALCALKKQKKKTTARFLAPPSQACQRSPHGASVPAGAAPSLTRFPDPEFAGGTAFCRGCMGMPFKCFLVHREHADVALVSPRRVSLPPCGAPWLAVLC